MAENPPRVETRDVRPRALWLLGLAFALFVAFSAAGLLVFFDPDAGWISHREGRPAPVLQVAPGADYQAFLAGKRAELHDRGWIDREAGLVEIPIEEAMRLVAQGHRAETPIESAGCAGAACPGATPSARTIP
jgi:hypothetical protein